MNLNKTKAILLTNIPAPYRVAMLNYAQPLLNENNISLKVLFSAAGYKRRNYWEGSLSGASFSYRILDDFHIQLFSEKFFSTGWSVKKALDEEKPSVIVSGGFSLPSIFACNYARKHNIPFLIYSGETNLQSQRRHLSWLRKQQRKYLLSRCAAYIAYGAEAKAFLISSGANETKVFVAINSIDTEQFRLMLLKAKNGNKKLLSAQPKMLFVGNLQKLKGLEHVLSALRIVQHEYKISLSFDIVGDGPDSNRLRWLANKFIIKDMLFWGSKSYEEVAPFYAQSDFFVFPSLYDIYGLVMVEAAAAGLPIIASKFAGGTVDVVQDGKNGYVIDPTNIEEFAARIKELCENRQRCWEMGKASLDIIKNSVNIRKSAEGFVESIDYALENSK